MRKWFTIDIDIFDEYPIQYTRRVEDYLKETEEIVKNDYDFAFIIIERKEISRRIYSEIKSELLANGIPSQFINSDRLLINNNYQWILINLSISFYAKIGGTPWVISANQNQSISSDIVLGMSRAIDQSKNFIIGFTTIHKSNGDFILSKFQAPVSTWEEYEESLKILVKKSIESYRQKENEPETIVCHFHKRTGRKELNAVVDGLSETVSEAKFALLHLNSYSNYRLFDTSTSSYVPANGLMVKISQDYFPFGISR